MEENPNNSLEEKLSFIDDEVHDSSIPEPEDYLAKKEAESYSKKKADVIDEQGIQLHKVLFKIASVFIWVLSILFLTLLLIWFTHIIFPNCWKWLNESDVQTIERILFASTILSFAGKYFSKFKILDNS